MKIQTDFDYYEFILGILERHSSHGRGHGVMVENCHYSDDLLDTGTLWLTGNCWQTVSNGLCPLW